MMGEAFPIQRTVLLDRFFVYFYMLDLVFFSVWFCFCISVKFGATGISSPPYVILYDPVYPANNHVGLELCKASFW